VLEGHLALLLARQGKRYAEFCERVAVKASGLLVANVFIFKFLFFGCIYICRLYLCLFWMFLSTTWISEWVHALVPVTKSPDFVHIYSATSIPRELITGTHHVHVDLRYI
jgi:hypothetical protein